MPKDITKLSLKEFEAVSNGDFDSRTRWENGSLVLTVAKAQTQGDEEDDD